MFSVAGLEEEAELSDGRVMVVEDFGHWGRRTGGRVGSQGLQKGDALSGLGFRV